MAAEGRETDRALANAIVSGLTGFYGGVDSHKSGAKDCPLATRKRTDYKVAAGPQKFDDSCRKKLKAKLGPRLEAMDSLLKTFPVER
jgi:hypothetical protein